MKDRGELFESTMYAGHHYGSRKEDVQNILDSGKHVLTVMDICGAMSMKTHFPNVVTVYLRRGKRDILSALLRKPLQEEEKISRILALEGEEKNAAICDYTVDSRNAEAAAEDILTSLFGKRRKKA
jgi:guanylate kinase